MSGASAPGVSVIVPTRDRPNELRRAVRSVFTQGYRGPLECIVVFDQQEPRDVGAEPPPGFAFRVVRNERTRGLAGARNTGALAASGELLAFLDDDDEWLPQKLARQVDVFLADPTAAAATCGILVTIRGREVRRTPPARVTLDLLVRSRREVHSSTLLMRRERFLGDIGMIDEEIPGSYGEDYDWILRAAAAGPIVAASEPMVRVYRDSTFFSDRWTLIPPALLYQLEKHPEISRNRRNRARMYGRIAFAHAAAGKRSEARVWAGRCLKSDPAQGRGYLAYLVSAGLLRPGTIQRAAAALGRGV